MCQTCSVPAEMGESLISTLYAYDLPYGRSKLRSTRLSLRPVELVSSTRSISSWNRRAFYGELVGERFESTSYRAYLGVYIAMYERFDREGCKQVSRKGPYVCQLKFYAAWSG